MSTSTADRRRIEGRIWFRIDSDEGDRYLDTPLHTVYVASRLSKEPGAVQMRLAYHHPRAGAVIENRQAVRVAREGFELRTPACAEVLCWGVMPSGMLRHPLFVR